MDKIVTGPDLWKDSKPRNWAIKRAARDGINLKPGYSGFVFSHLKHKKHIHTIATGARKGVPIAARINHGRWIMDCPYCSGAEMVDPDDKRFFCLHCFMEENLNKPRPVTFPPKPQRLAIERVLLLRPLKINRNWFPGETIAELKQENIDNGLEV